MIPFARFTWQAAAAGRWIARVVGTLTVLFVLAFVFGEGPPPILRMSTREQLYALGMGGLFLGLVVAWFREGWGGLISVMGWAFLAVLAGRPLWELPFSIPAGAGLLHLVCWWRLRGPAPVPRPVSAEARARLKIAYTFAWGAVAVFVLLSANEIFGQPPLMTPSAQPPAELAGTWSATLTTAAGHPLPKEVSVVFTIGPDGSVSGSVGNVELARGQFTPNRSWFGRLMNWRTDYMIRGTLARAVESPRGTVGDRISVPLARRGSVLAGTLSLSRPSAPNGFGLTLRKQ